MWKMMMMLISISKGRLPPMLGSWKGDRVGSAESRSLRPGNLVARLNAFTYK